LILQGFGGFFFFQWKVRKAKYCILLYIDRGKNVENFFNISVRGAGRILYFVTTNFVLTNFALKANIDHLLGNTPDGRNKEQER